ncbi:hypothetical protein EVG20_g10204 [Dentipellis fragilis]|uniref:Uncharacterized protein n=1 Tax=Dentipellis fragilis TaxID=205917 RepID=A0A4Y9XU07_9AGAM|nr:hypothetical protein EVG20_g10204 [Dentipellis fragilis]
MTYQADFLGPTAVATFIEAIETGVLFSQSVRFWGRAETEPFVIKLLVAFVSLVAFFQTGGAFYTAWRIYVVNFGNWAAALNPGWPERIQSVITALMATPVQAFLIWRCWNILNRRHIILIPFTAALLGSLGTSIAVTTFVVNFNFLVAYGPNALPPQKLVVSTPFILSLILPACLDIAVTAILLTFLLRSRANVYTRQFRRSNRNFWDLTFQAILGKLYVISLFVTLNGRADITAAQHARSHFPTLTSVGMSVAGMSGVSSRLPARSFHVELSTGGPHLSLPIPGYPGPEGDTVGDVGLTDDSTRNSPVTPTGHMDLGNDDLEKRINRQCSIARLLSAMTVCSRVLESAHFSVVIGCERLELATAPSATPASIRGADPHGFSFNFTIVAFEALHPGGAVTGPDGPPRPLWAAAVAVFQGLPHGYGGRPSHVRFSHLPGPLNVWERSNWRQADKRALGDGDNISMLQHTAACLLSFFIAALEPALA